MTKLDAATCPHKRHHASVHVRRAEGAEGGGVNFTAVVNILCADCGVNFAFSGVPQGDDFSKPTCGPFGFTLTAPITPGPATSADKVLDIVDLIHPDK
jgi:hypothetical protein